MEDQFTATAVVLAVAAAVGFLAIRPFDVEHQVWEALKCQHRSAGIPSSTE